MAWRPDRVEWTAMVGLAVLALVVKLPLLHAAPYGDESLFFFGSAHPGQAPLGISQPDGRPVYFPTSLVWERPAFYALFWLPAQFGFAAFRSTHAVLASLLAPLAFALLRAHGMRRSTATLAGVAVATVPLLVVWGTYALTDSIMTLWLAVAMLARRSGRHALAGAALLVAIWTKETAYVAVLAWFATDWWASRWASRRSTADPARLWPLRLDARLSSSAWPLAVGLFPFLYAVAKGFPSPAPVPTPLRAGALDEVWLSSLALPILLAGAWRRRSRSLAATGLAGGAILLLLQAGAHFAIQSWYLVPATFFAVVGVAASCDALLPGRSRDLATPPTPMPPAGHRRRPVAGIAAAVLAIALVAGLVLLPAGSGRGLLRPLGGDPGDPLLGTYAYELRLRDHDLLEAYAAIPLDGQHDVVAVDLFHAHLYTLAPRTHHLWSDSSYFRALQPLRIEPLAQRIEANGTWTLVAKQATPWNEAVREVYADCLVRENAQYAVYVGGSCAGRATRLAERALALERDQGP